MRHPVIGQFVEARSDTAGFIVGAAVGSGLMARAAEAGGADFILAVNAGRYRLMGAASLASLLPIADCNQLVLDVARTEILPSAGIPVFFGAAAWDPALDMAAFMGRLKQAGFAGVANFPNCVNLDGTFRAALDEAGLGFDREAAMLAEARRQGLATIGYAKRRQEVMTLADVGVDVVCLNFGWNTGGLLGVNTAMSAQEAGRYAKRLRDEAIAVTPETLFTIEGGPIVSPEQMEEACQIGSLEGYIGGSTIDRLPLESAVADTTRAFKSVPVHRPTRDEPDQALTGIAERAGIVGQSQALRDLLNAIRKVAASDLPVLIQGEHGTGKELVAYALHRESARAGREMVTVNSAALPHDLLESELFGYEPGAFTGAQRRRVGRFESADRSSLFLDEIGELTPLLQAKLLRVLENGVFERLGSNTPHRANVRVISATNQDLAAMVRAGTFREDLYFRLNGVRLIVPPLRERLEDLPALIDHFLAIIGNNLDGRARELDRSAYRSLLAYDWPGNVRELRHVLEQAALMADGPLISARDLPSLEPLHGGAGQAVEARAEAGPAPRVGGPPTGQDEAPASEAAVAARPPSSERDWLLEGLRRNRFRRGETARDLRISRKTLYNKMRAHGLFD